MIARFRAKIGLLSLSAAFLLFLSPAGPIARSADAQTGSSPASTDLAGHVSPGPIDGQIAYFTASMLEGSHYSKKTFSDSVSSKFLDVYLDTLDPLHIHFTQQDLADFEQYRTNLNHLTVTEQRVGDTRPGCEIFNRFYERLSQRTAYVEAMLKNEKFTFDTDEKVTLNRKELPYPKDLDEAQQLWRQRARFEYLQELLGKIGNRKKPTALASGKTAPSKETTSAPAPAQKPTISAPTVASAPAERHRPVLYSPKGSEQVIPVLLAARAEQPSNANCCPPETQPTVAQKATSAPAAATAHAAMNSATKGAAPAPKKSDHEEIVETLMHRYHRTLRFFADWNNEDVLQTYLSALAHVYDPHSDYMGHAQLNQFAMSMNLSLFGIGAELMLSDDGYCTIRRLLPGGPALKSKKIKENDRIVAVAQGDQTPVDVVDMSLPKAVQLIRGAKGTEVRLTIIPAGAESSARQVVSIIRDEIPLEESAAKARIIEVPDGTGGHTRLGLIDLPSFYATFDVSNSKDKPEPKSTTADVARLLHRLEQENVRGIILDLRRNGGGSLEEAIRLTGLFIKSGPVVQVRQGDGKVEPLSDNDPSVLYEGPLVVMTSRGSASASEIVAGALQDYGRALIVGDISTHGKGTVQSVNSLAPLVRRAGTNDPGALKLTIKKFYRPSGNSTQLKGVTPDIVLPSLANESKDAGEKALDNALPWDEIKSAKFDHFNLVEPYLTELRRRSAERVGTNQEYVYVREDIQRYLKQQADKTISLNEEARLKENEENQARDKARDKERLARHQPPETIYELTLKDVDKPGLPPPLGSTNTVAAAKPAMGVPGIGTNSVASAGKAVPVENVMDEAEEEKPPPIDVPLEETEHILVDYLSLLPKGNLVSAER